MADDSLPGGAASEGDDRRTAAPFASGSEGAARERGRLTADERSTVGWGPGVAIGFIVASQIVELMWAGIVVTASGVDDLTIPWTMAALLGLWSMYGVGSVALARGFAGGDLRAGLASLGVSRDDLANRRLLRLGGVGLAVGVVAQLVAVPIVYAALSPLIDTSAVEQVARDLIDTADGTLDRVLLAVMVIVIAPVVEELAFRGVVVGGLRRGLGVWPAVVVSAVLFAMVHLAPVTWPGLFVFGLALAVLRLRTGSLLPPVLAHVAFNAVTVIVLFADIELPY